MDRQDCTIVQDSGIEHIEVHQRLAVIHPVVEEVVARSLGMVLGGNLRRTLTFVPNHMVGDEIANIAPHI